MRDEDAIVDMPDGWKVPKRTSFVEVEALKDHRSSTAISLVSSTVSSLHLQQEVDEDEASGDTSTPSDKLSGSYNITIFVSCASISNQKNLCSFGDKERLLFVS